MDEAAKDVARAKRKSPTSLEALARWWSRKYKLPSNHELFLERTEFEHLVEFYEDLFDAKPLEAHRTENGDVQFVDTGDSLIDKWETELAKGLDPNFWEAFSPELQEKFKKRIKPGGYGADDMFDPVKQRRSGLSMAEVSASMELQNQAERATTMGGSSYLRAFERLKK